ncbi:PIG-L family deacetylase [Modestobacter sp. Leaf380]|uniref:PIG-L family deacetylase n=1 Tax=Modestobacter sp. Leaf380 TaxID=1736356 RepID=UPI0006F80546|nr:PIG-L family deacetylase [Modestobacter sp. Leaf380]KQS65039.1 GlcNAc-PI de-N-acetylase [Modestobacter sp. Leaf380]
MLTLMAVHAHPDDEATSTGGILAHYAAQGVRTVLVTCTNGEQGDHGDLKPGDAGHDREQVVAARMAELRESADILGVTHLETLGYADSGMMGWASNEAPGSFWSTPVEEAAGVLAELVRRYRPDVVVTYDENGFYGHPDHIQANRVTVAALDAAGSDAKLYWSTIRRSAFARFGEMMAESGLELPQDEEMPEMGAADEEIGATVDCRPFAEAKHAALRAHASQSDAAFFLGLPLPLFTEMMGVEEFVRVRPPWAPGDEVETDLLAGR